METTRDLTKVLENMIGEIPIDVENSDLMKRFMSIRESATYSAPENMWSWWCEASQVLELYFPDPSKLNDWQQTVINIWMDKI